MFKRKYRTMKLGTLIVILLCAAVKVAFRSFIMYGFIECFRRFGLCSTAMGSVLAVVLSYGFTRFVMIAARKSFFNTDDDTPRAISDLVILGMELICRIFGVFSVKKRRVSQ